MKIDYTINKEKGIITEIWREKVSFEDYKDLKSREFSDPDFNNSYDIISDLRNASLSYSEKDMNKIIQLFKENQEEIGNRKSALVTSNPIQVASTILFKEKIKYMPINVRIFSTREAAEQWISGD